MESTLWAEASTLMRQRINKRDWNNWFNSDVIVKTEQRGNIFYLCVADGWAKGAVQLYMDVIKDSLETMAAQSLTIMVVDVTCEVIPPVEISPFTPVSSEIAFNPRYTFDTFVVGSSNRMAWAAAQAVAESPSRSYNPLFIYGGSGLGKTHLMHAIGQAVRKRTPHRRVIYVSSETFTSEFIYLLREGRMEDFKRRYRAVDILLIDDIQFLANKKETQEEFFHTFNSLHDAGKQVVISSDRHPNEISTLEERLRNRFTWGLTCDITEPDWETRCAILQSKAISGGVAINNDVLSLVAEKVSGNIRELEGALNRLMYFSELNQSDNIDMQLAQKALKELFIASEQPKLTIPYIQTKVAEYYDITMEEMKSQRKEKRIAFPRQVAMYLCRNLTESSLAKVGEMFGGRDHTTVMSAYRKITAERLTNSTLNETLNRLEHSIKGNQA